MQEPSIGPSVRGGELCILEAVGSQWIILSRFSQMWVLGRSPGSVERVEIESREMSLRATVGSEER